MQPVAILTSMRASSSQKLAVALVNKGWVVHALCGDRKLALELSQQDVKLTDISITDENAVSKFIKNIVRDEGQIDHVFYTARHHSFAAVEIHDDTDGRFQFEVNLFGAMNVLREVALVMRAQKFGAFTMFSAGRLSSRFSLAAWHNACEAAIDSMMQSVQAEFATFGAKVNHIHCGLQVSNVRQISDNFIDHDGHLNAYDRIAAHAEHDLSNLADGAHKVDEIVALGLRYADAGWTGLNYENKRNGFGKILDKLKW